MLTFSREVRQTLMKEKIREVLEKEFKLIGFKESTVKTLRKAYGGSQTAIITLSVKAALKLLAAGRGKNRLGAGAGIAEAVLLMPWLRSYREGMFQCCRSTLCRRCGAEGHISKHCGAIPDCPLCCRRHVNFEKRCPKFGDFSHYTKVY